MNKNEINLVALAQKFGDEEKAREYLENLRWQDGKPVCPHCGHEGYRINRRPTAGRKAQKGVCKCRNRECRKQFTVTKGTVFESSHIKLSTWLIAVYIICSSKKAISAHQVHRMLGITYKTAWFMCHRIRYAMDEGPFKGILKGEVEVDETYIGGKPRRGAGIKHKRGRGTSKAPVIALVERNGKVKSKPIKRLTGKELKGAIREMVDKKSTIYTDELPVYYGIGKFFKGGHETVCHGKREYVKGDASTNTAESYFSLLKRGVMGAFHHVSKKHLHLYCKEFDFRWNHRKINDGERMVAALSLIGEKRLRYRDSSN